jgi:hypothetical protein
MGRGADFRASRPTVDGDTSQADDFRREVDCEPAEERWITVGASLAGNMARVATTEKIKNLCQEPQALYEVVPEQISNFGFASKARGSEHRGKPNTSCDSTWV